MSFATLRHLFGTLRFRLTLWNTAVVLLTVVVALVAVRGGLRRLMLVRLDEFLQEESVEVEHRVAKQYPRWESIHAELDQKALDHPRRALFVQLFTPAGELLWSSTHTPPAPWCAELLGTPAVGVALVDHYRLLQRPLRGPFEPPLVLRIGVSTARAESDLARFTRQLLAVGALVLLLSPLGGYLLACRVTRPLSRIITTAARLQPKRLAERLPLRHTDDELDRMSATINGLLDRIAQYLEQNREFTANVAHEIRTPLAAIQNSLEVALSSRRSREEYEETLTVLLEECDYLRILVNRMLLLAESDAGRLTPGGERIALDRLALRSLSMFEGLAEAAGLRLTTGRLEPVEVRGDAGQLRQVINNLLDNAIKYARGPGAITLDVWRDAGQAVLRVTDSGVGIPPEDLPHIFERFYRGDKSRQRASARRDTGLGLCICQALVAAHGGKITVASTVGVGSQFTVRLPAFAPAEEGAGRTPASLQAPAVLR